MLRLSTAQRVRPPHRLDLAAQRRPDLQHARSAGARRAGREGRSSTPRGRSTTRSPTPAAPRSRAGSAPPSCVPPPPGTSWRSSWPIAVTLPGVDIGQVIQVQRTATLRTLQELTKTKNATDDPESAEALAWLLVVDSLIFAGRGRGALAGPLRGQAGPRIRRRACRSHAAEYRGARTRPPGEGPTGDDRITGRWDTRRARPRYFARQTPLPLEISRDYRDGMTEPPVSAAKTLWWAVLLRGVFAIIFGILALVAPTIALTGIAIVFGAYALVDGITESPTASGRRGTSGAGGRCSKASSRFWPDSPPFPAPVGRRPRRSPRALDDRHLQRRAWGDRPCLGAGVTERRQGLGHHLWRDHAAVRHRAGDTGAR